MIEAYYCNLHDRYNCTLCDECGHESALHDNAWNHPAGEERDRIFDNATCWAENICSACVEDAANRPAIERYGTPEHEAWLIEMEQQEG